MIDSNTSKGSAKITDNGTNFYTNEVKISYIINNFTNITNKITGKIDNIEITLNGNIYVITTDGLWKNEKL